MLACRLLVFAERGRGEIEDRDDIHHAKLTNSMRSNARDRRAGRRRRCFFSLSVYTGRLHTHTCIILCNLSDGSRLICHNQHIGITLIMQADRTIKEFP